ncbi:Crp/Fnr family transcriptional regulator [Methylobacterium sp. GC_Met_2]|uniref:Crp/Fnr family transcriptional regulator n=1 Tax=Methylobacterium sp. GC_Met_2 TaxID=2937376 RepID=UPI00226B2432|nr:Crp/Fnr family transcriptional regulator [Methylobacterium sp. GC_Met_2]
MTASVHQSDLDPVVHKIESIATFRLSNEERDALLSLPMHAAMFEADQDIVTEGDRPTRAFAILSGFACTYKTTYAGKRQVMAYHVPGDVPDFQSLHLHVLDISISAVGPCRVGFVPHDAVRLLLSDHPRLTDTLWRATLIEAAIVREWMLNNGRREAYPRLAHLFCELITRLAAVELAIDQSCHLPMTQSEIADALGITSVHVNRVLREMRAKGLITLQGHHLTVHDWEGLKKAAEFDPTYLHLGNRDAVRGQLN